MHQWPRCASAKRTRSAQRRGALDAPSVAGERTTRIVVGARRSRRRHAETVRFGLFLPPRLPRAASRLLIVLARVVAPRKSIRPLGQLKSYTKCTLMPGVEFAREMVEVVLKFGKCACFHVLFDLASLARVVAPRAPTLRRRARSGMHQAVNRTMDVFWRRARARFGYLTLRIHEYDIILHSICIIPMRNRQP